MASITCNIVSPEGELFSGEVEQLTAEGGEGEIAITPRHAPLLTNLKANPEKEYILWPNRLEKVEQFEDHIQKIYRG